MTKSERIRASKNLCYCDPRNPDADPDVIEENLYPVDNCLCDNCFMGVLGWLRRSLSWMMNETVYEDMAGESI